MSGEVSVWESPPSQLTLATGDVHVWRAPLELPPVRIAEFGRLLDAEEARRAQRFRFERDRNRFIAARGSLKALLGRYLECAPLDLRFASGPNGKPSLAAPATDVPLQFNVSHSGTLALYAFARRRNVGIDVEAVRSDVDVEGIARKYFTSRESEVLLELPAEERVEAFFRCWTRKEAFVKARGDGVLFSLKKFEVSLDSVEPALLAADDDDIGRWSMRDIALGSAYKAAVVIERKDWTLSCWEMT